MSQFIVPAPRTSQAAPVSRARRQVAFEDVAALLIPCVHPVVEAHLIEDVRSVAAGLWTDEVQAALRLVAAAEDSDAEAEVLRLRLTSALVEKAPPSREVVKDACVVAARTMASAWLEFLGLALEGRAELRLNASLLPVRDEGLDEELWEALRASLYALPVTNDEAPAIMEEFAGKLFKGSGSITVAGRSFEIVRRQNAEPPFIARPTTR